MDICKESAKKHRMERSEINLKHHYGKYKNDPACRERKKYRSREWRKAHSEYVKE